jgi:hypothetical protein
MRGRGLVNGTGFTGHLTWHNPNSLLLVEGPEITIQPAGIRRLPAGAAWWWGGDHDLYVTPSLACPSRGPTVHACYRH